jgi:hypothetical protein
MIFGIIGYTAQYTDHTQIGWPLRLAAALATQSAAQDAAPHEDTVSDESPAPAIDPLPAEPEVAVEANKQADVAPDRPA